MSFLHFCIPAIVLTVASSPSYAQDKVVTDSLETRAHRHLQHTLERHDEARFRISGSEWVNIHEASLNESQLIFQSGGDRSPVDLADISKIQVRTSSSGRGALIGGLVGLAGGAVGGAALANWGGPLGGEGGDTGEIVGGAVLLGMIGGAAGAGLGALIGLGFTHWATVYEASPTVGFHAHPQTEPALVSVEIHY